MNKFLNTRTLAIAVLALASLALVSTSVLAAPNGGSKPGWGYGDKNHVHTGPPGQTVRPNP